MYTDKKFICGATLFAIGILLLVLLMMTSRGMTPWFDLLFNGTPEEGFYAWPKPLGTFFEVIITLCLLVGLFLGSLAEESD